MRARGGRRDRATPLPPGVGIVTVTALAAVLRFARLDYLSLRIDEGFTLQASRQSWSVVLGLRGAYDPHPPLYFVLAKAAALATSDVLGGRLVSAAAATATVPVLYALVARLLDRRAALAAALLLTVSPLHVQYARDARMFAPVTFAVAVSYLALVAWWQAPSRRWAAVYGAALALAVYLDYSAAFALAPQALLLVLVAWEHRDRAIGLLMAAAGAVVAFLPWLPQLLGSVESVAAVDRRQSYLGAAPSRVAASVLALIGLDGRGSAPDVAWPNAWDRWPDVRGALLVALLPAALPGAVALARRSPGAVLVGLGLAVGTPLAAIGAGRISPGYADRTVLSAVLGWAVIAGASWQGASSPRGWRSGFRLVGRLGWVYLMVVSVITLRASYSREERIPWPEAAADLGRVSGLGAPLMTYSFAGVADALVDAYAGESLAAMPRITIVDGDLEASTGSAGWFGGDLTRAAVAAGAMAEVLPSDEPARGLVWFLTYRATGTPEIRAATEALGFERLLRHRYTGGLTLELYARPGARLGPEVEVNGRFADGAAGWTLPPGAETDGGAAGRATERTLLVPNGGEDRAAVRRWDGASPTLATLRVGVFNADGSDAGRATLRCRDRGGGVRRESSAGAADGEGTDGAGWQEVRLAILCPAGSAALDIALWSGGGEAAFRDVRLAVVPTTPAGTAGGPAPNARSGSTIAVVPAIQAWTTGREALGRTVGHLTVGTRSRGSRPRRTARDDGDG